MSTETVIIALKAALEQNPDDLGIRLHLAELLLANDATGAANHFAGSERGRHHPIGNRRGETFDAALQLRQVQSVTSTECNKYSASHTPNRPVAGIRLNCCYNRIFQFWLNQLMFCTFDLY